ncbi:MAG: DNA polymerase III subunit delta [Anaerolineae bacterium]|nr:DNA polymerase III subunit delta [Anaerolineae bacterium]MBL6965225.1 DNA polymerase III subunit delta [Anaerolineales bacterium]
MAAKPVIYLLHGDDEFAIAQFVAEMERKLGDPATAQMNTIRLEKGKLALDELIMAVQSLPFLAERRLVIVYEPLSSLKSAAMRERFQQILTNIPPTTALALVISRPLQSYQDKKKNKLHWLQKWAADRGGRVYEKVFLTARGPELVRWLQKYTKSEGGELTPEGAAVLASLIGEDPRIAVQEINKLLAYVNYNRPIEPDDVEYLVAPVGSSDVFAMVDALGNRQGRQALRMLHQLFEEDAPLRLMGMVVRQFRLLIQTRELLDAGYRQDDIARELKTHRFVIGKIINQARNFSQSALETIYRELLAIDQAIKIGQMDGDIALDTFIARLAT